MTTQVKGKCNANYSGKKVGKLRALVLGSVFAKMADVGVAHRRFHRALVH